MAYVARATTKGGRDGRAVLEDGKLALAMALPKDMCGKGEVHNPEQLFGLDGSAAKVTCAIEIDKDATSFALKADIAVSIPGADKAKVKALADDAHQICPYSKATRNNIPVTLSVV
jgi:osmotically inducible protein OsmC